MTQEKAKTLDRLKHELLFKALIRSDNSEIYIFLKDDEGKRKYNLLITGEDNGIRNALYRFREEGDQCFILIEDRNYEILLPDRISDEEPFSLQLKDAGGNTIEFKDYF